MGIFKRLTPEEQSAEDRRRAVEQQAKAQRKADEQAERERQAFLASPQGMARTAYERGDLILQSEFELGTQQALVAVMMTAFTVEKTGDPTAILNAIASEGWDLVNGSVVFVTTGQESRDKSPASGQQVAIGGKTMGYYLWRRRA